MDLKFELIKPIFSKSIRVIFILLNFLLYFFNVFIVISIIKDPILIISIITALGYLQFTTIQKLIIDKYNVIDFFFFYEEFISFSNLNIYYNNVFEIKIKGTLGLNLGRDNYDAYKIEIIKKDGSVINNIHVKSTTLENKKWFKGNDLILTLEKKRIKWSIF